MIRYESASAASIRRAAAWTAGVRSATGNTRDPRELASGCDCGAVQGCSLCMALPVAVAAFESRMRTRQGQVTPC